VGERESSELSLEDLAERTGQPPERLLEWRALGVIGSPDRAEFARRDVERVQLIGFCLARGVGIETIARAEETEAGLLGHYLEQMFPTGDQPTYTLAEAAARAGFGVEMARRLHHVSGPPWLGERIVEEDIELLHGWKVALENGLPEEALIQLTRVYADSLGRVAEAEARLFHFYVHDRIREIGLSGRELRERTEGASEPKRRLIEPALLYFHRKGMASAVCEDMLLHFAEYSGSKEKRDGPAQMRLAIGFLDLASFTPMTESLGDVAAAAVVALFSDLVREVASRHRGRVVERIGDAFMFTFTEPETAVGCLLEIRERARHSTSFPPSAEASTMDRSSTAKAATSARTSTLHRALRPRQSVTKSSSRPRYEERWRLPPSISRRSASVG